MYITRFRKLLEDLENSYNHGNDRYPNTVTESYKIFMNWKQDPRNMIHIVRSDMSISTGGGVVFKTFTSKMMTSQGKIFYW